MTAYIFSALIHTLLGVAFVVACCIASLRLVAAVTPSETEGGS